MTLDELRDRWIEERPKYNKFVDLIRAIIAHECRTAGIYCYTDGRAKEVASLVKKQIKNRYEDPWERMGDKAGVRVIAVFRDTVPAIEEIVARRFEATGPDRKAEKLGVEKLGYQGIHYQVRLREEDLTGEAEVFRDLEAELQIHTKAQNLWSDVSHQLAYKVPVETPQEAARLIHLVNALVEVIDKEFVDARTMIRSIPGYEQHKMLDELEARYYPLASHDFDRELSLEIIQGLKGLFQPGEINGIGAIIDQFVDKRRERLRQLYEIYRDDPRGPELLFQPEALLILERLEKDQFGLLRAWQQKWPMELLDHLATAWGYSLPELS